MSRPPVTFHCDIFGCDILVSSQGYRELASDEDTELLETMASPDYTHDSDTESEPSEVDPEQSLEEDPIEEDPAEADEPPSAQATPTSPRRPVILVRPG
ncbi:hypothetical protein Tco_1186063 [Tanacetum coccineum]